MTPPESDGAPPPRIVPDGRHVQPVESANKIPIIYMPRLVCPECKSKHVRKNGARVEYDEQYYRCAMCCDENKRPTTFKVIYIDTTGTRPTTAA